jgi:hypothetical protein
MLEKKYGKGQGKKSRLRSSISVCVMAVRVSMTILVAGDSQLQQMKKTSNGCTMLREVTDET